MNAQTERYLRRNGVSDPVLADLRDGKAVLITADGLTSWLRGAFMDGKRMAHAEIVAEARAERCGMRAGDDWFRPQLTGELEA